MTIEYEMIDAGTGERRMVAEPDVEAIQLAKFLKERLDEGLSLEAIAAEILDLYGREEIDGEDEEEWWDALTS